MSMFKVGDKVTVPYGSLSSNREGGGIELTSDDVGTIISIDTNGSTLWPISVVVEGKNPCVWDDDAWHFNDDELERVK